MTAWTEERLDYDLGPWGWNSFNPFLQTNAGWNDQFSGWNSTMKIFTEEAGVPDTGYYGDITEEVP